MFKLLSIVIVCIIASGNVLASEKPIVALNQFVSHPALDAASSGVQKALRERGILPYKAELKIANAQGNITNSTQIAKHQAALKPIVMIGIPTPSAQADLKARSDDTIIFAFAAVTDPVAAGLGAGKNVIGVTDTPPIERLIDIALQILPHIKTVGVIFNPGEANSVNTVELLENVLAQRHIKLLKATLNSSSGTKLAVQKLIGAVDVIYLPQDNTVVSAINAVIKDATNAMLPVIANDPLLVDQGVLLGLGCDYFSSGKQLGYMIADRLENKVLQSNIQSPDAQELRINDAVAKALGIQIPEDIRNREKS